jgi:methyl-accepting chemotaxis protein
MAPARGTSASAAHGIHVLVMGIEHYEGLATGHEGDGRRSGIASAPNFVALSGATVDRRSFLRINPTIAHKALILISALGLMSGIANWYCLRTVDRIEEANRVVTEHIAPARLALSEAKGALTAFGLGVYKMSAYVDRAQVAEEANAMVGEFNAIGNALDNVRGYDPERTQDIAQLVGKLEVLHALAEDVHRLTIDGKREEVRFLLEFKFIAALEDAVFHLNRLINILGAGSESAVQEAEVARSWTIDVARVSVLGGTLATLAVALALSQYSLARPLRRLADVMKSMARGEFASEIDGLARQDEVGAMARSVAVFRENGIALKRLEQQRTDDKARAEAERRDAFAKLVNAFERDVLSVVGIVSHAAVELEKFATAMKAIAEQSESRSLVAAQAAEETMRDAGTAASAVEELSASISNISGQAVSASTVVAEAKRCAQIAVTNAQGLTSTVEQIDRVTGLVNSIARQTNLLALNATIEAARAGPAGRGFAVVAQEVKNLAAQTTQALTDISRETASVQQATQAVVAAISAISGVIGAIDDISLAITDAVGQQNVASRNIAQNVDDAAVRTRQVSTIISAANEFAVQTGELAGRILQAAQDLSQQAVVLQTDAAGFIGQVKAA